MNPISTLPSLKKTVCHPYQRMKCFNSCHNQYRTGENYFEIAITTDGYKLIIEPAREKVSGESYYFPETEPKWAYIFHDGKPAMEGGSPYAQFIEHRDEL